MNTITRTGRQQRTVTDCDTYGRRLHGASTQASSASVTMAATGSKKLTKRMIREIASSISEELPPGFPKELLG